MDIQMNNKILFIKTLHILKEGTHESWFQGNIFLITSDFLGAKFHRRTFLVTILF